MKLYTHESKEDPRNCVIVLANDREIAKRMIREQLNQIGAKKEKINITQAVKPSRQMVVYANKGEGKKQWMKEIMNKISQLM